MLVDRKFELRWEPVMQYMGGPENFPPLKFEGRIATSADIKGDHDISTFINANKRSGCGFAGAANDLVNILVDKLKRERLHRYETAEWNLITDRDFFRNSLNQCYVAAFGKILSPFKTEQKDLWRILFSQGDNYFEAAVPLLFAMLEQILGNEEKVDRLAGGYFERVTFDYNDLMNQYKNWFTRLEFPFGTWPGLQMFAAQQIAVKWVRYSWGYADGRDVFDGERSFDKDDALGAIKACENWARDNTEMLRRNYVGCELLCRCSSEPVPCLQDFLSVRSRIRR